MTKKVRWGIIGTGKIARTFAGGLDLIDEGEVVAVGSRTMESADAFAAEFECTPYDSYEAVCADPSVDAIYVATPHPMHHDNALLALDAGKHILVEKAFTMSGDEARSVVAAARQRGLFAMEAMWTRFLPHVEAIRQLINEGAIGRIVQFEADHGKWFAHDPHSRLFAPELGGSALLDLGVYPVSFASMLLGTASRQVALVDPAFTGVDGQCSMVFGYDNGAHAILTTTSAARSATRACITGEEGRIEIDGDFYAPTSFTLIPRIGERTHYTFDVEGRGLHFQAQEVARCLEQGLTESPVMPLDETIAIMDTMTWVMNQLEPVPGR